MRVKCNLPIEPFYKVTILSTKLVELMLLFEPQKIYDEFEPLSATHHWKALLIFLTLCSFCQNRSHFTSYAVCCLILLWLSCFCLLFSSPFVTFYCLLFSSLLSYCRLLFYSSILSICCLLFSFPFVILLPLAV